MIYINNEQKVKDIKLEKDNFYVVADFDQTLTEGSKVSTWAIMANANQVGEEYKERRNALYHKYRPIEIDSELSDEEKSKAMSEWWQAHINLFYEYGLKEEAIKNSLKDGGLKYRAGAKEFLAKMNEFGIPVIIISAGIGNVIEEFFYRENDYYPNIKIVSNFINFENGTIKSIRGETIHALNKNIVNLDEESKKSLKNRKYKLLLGDGIADLKMISEEERKSAITIGFLDEKIEENLKFYNEKFDIVLTHQGSYEDVNNILNIY